MKSKNTYSQKRFITLVFVLLFGIHFCGFAPIALLYPSGSIFELPLFAILLFFSFFTKKSEYSKWLKLLLISLFINYLSSMYFENRSFIKATGSAYFVYGLFFFFPITYIKPSIKQIEKSIMIVGLICLILYFIQYLLLPTPILESLITGWRTGDNILELDIKRYTVTGEIIMYLLVLMSFNKYLLKRNKKYIIIIIAVICMSILHGYRTIILAMFLSLLFLYFKIVGFKFNTRTIALIFLTLTAYYVISYSPIFQDIINFMNEKNDRDLDVLGYDLSEISRFIELDFFFNHQIQNPIEWVFGCGFLSKEEYRNATNIQYFVNWVDLGFIGFSFMGGLIMTFCWIKLLLLNMRKLPLQYIYISGFSFFVILSSTTLPTAFNDRAPVIQALALYSGYIVLLKNNIYKKSQ